MIDLNKAKYPSNFTKDQVRALDKMQAWYFNNNELEFCLSGPAGTGKTYIIKYFLDNIVKTRCCVTAPTHKAVRVIENMTGRQGKTLHSLHALRPNISLEDFDIDKVKFDPIGNPHMRNYFLVVIDESSQINNDLFVLNKTRAKQYNTKILYVGDEYQLPPIKERLSRAFRVKNKVILTDIVRQEAGNPLLELLSIVRDDVKHRSSKFMTYLRQNKYNINSQGQGYMVVNNSDFNRLVVEYFSRDDFLNDINYARVAAWTNRRIYSINKQIRDIIIGNSDEVVDFNDLFIGYNTVVDEYLNPIIVNSEDYIIENLDYRETEMGFHIYEARFRGMNQRNSTPVRIVDHTSSSFIHFYNHINELHYTAITNRGGGSGRWKNYYNFKDRYFLLTTVPLLDSDNSVRSYVKKDIDYGYGLTIHKLQGSTVNNIFVDLTDIIYYKDKRNGKLVPVRDLETRNKLVYTALSRAKDKAIILFE